MEVEDVEYHHDSDDENEKANEKPKLKSSSSTLRISTHSAPNSPSPPTYSFSSSSSSSSSSSTSSSSTSAITEKPQISPEKISQLLLLEESIGPEPAENLSGVTTLILRLPSGENLQRRFLVNSQFQKIKDFVQVQALPKNGAREIPQDFFFATDYPRVELKDMQQTLADANLIAKRCNLRVVQ